MPVAAEQVEAVFLAALERPEHELESFLSERCSGDPELRKEVESLLGYSARAGSFLDHQELLALSPDLARAPDEVLAPATRFGEYVIERMIGSGGMGIVYVARQERPSRTVALKLVSPLMATGGLLRRFEQEAEVLGRLQHPGIAQIIGAGAAEIEGAPGRRPYIAMELVNGPPLTEYAAKQTVRKRIELVASVCDAIQHAHQRGVIHRDLKPANILVNESGQPKVLDFGVARATDADLRVTTLHTGFGQLIGTLPYMSPEQVTGDPTEIDIRSDVYALGVIMYELLTGKLPIDVSGRALPEAVRAIREHEPARLSAVNRTLRGDLETISFKALEKDKIRRYQSAADLAADLRRFLAGEAISARDASALYVLRKQLRRYRGAVTIAAGGLLALVVFAAYAAWQARVQRLLATNESEARREAVLARDLANSQAEELRKNLYVSAIGFAQASHAARDIGRMKRVLDTCPEDLRGWEWRYLRSLTDSSSEVLPMSAFSQRTESWVTFSPDGSIALARYGTDPIGVVDTRSLRPLMMMDTNRLFSEYAVVSRDNRWCVTGSMTGVVTVGDLETATVRGFTLSPGARVYVSAVSSDGRLGHALILPSEGPMRSIIFRMTDGSTVREIGVESAHQVAFSPAGEFAVLGADDGRVMMFDPRGEAPPRLLHRHDDRSRILAISHDGRRIASGSFDGSVMIHQLETGTSMRHRVFDNKIRALAWSPDASMIAAAGTEAVIGIIDAATGAPVTWLFGHETSIDALAWCPDEDEIVSWAFDYTVRRWKHPAVPVQPIKTMPGSNSTATWALDSRSVIIGFADGRVLQFDPRLDHVIGEFPRFWANVTEVAVSPDGAVLGAGSEEGCFKFFDMKTRKEISRFDTALGRGIDLSFHPTEPVAAFTDDALGVMLVDPYAGRFIRRLSFDVASTGARMSFSPDGRYLAVIHLDMALHLHDWRTGATVRVMTGPKEWSSQVSFSRDGSYVAVACTDGNIYIWSVEDGQLVRILVGHQRAVFSMSLSPDGTRLASGGWDNTFRLWDIERGDELLTFRPHKGANWVTEYSRDGESILTASQDGTAIVWNAGRRASRAATADRSE